MIPTAKKFRSAGISPELEEKLDKMFSLAVAIGDHVWMPSSGELPSLFSQHDTLSGDDEQTQEQNNPEAFASDDIGSATPGQTFHSGGVSKRKRKGKKLDMGVKKAMLSHIEKLRNSSDVLLQRVVAPVVLPSVYLLREAIQELERYQEIFEDKQLYHFATIHFQTPVNRVTFLSILEDKLVEWLQTHYINSLNS
ncbi:hypothetical protein KSP40_PGU020823 [Platanthera guangdongensis]|uniref:Uncharacterized protein n=1 Tax=Platanthera guangdongensis TaxID=2320717 RepID=A0ABR2MGX5_9ASPA